MKHAKNKTTNLVMAALFAALTAVLSQIQLPIGPIPFNLGVFGAFIAGMLLMPLWAAASMGVYMLLGVMGIPVFVGFQGGPGVLFGKTGGYVIGYIIIALCTSLSRQKGNIFITALGMAAGLFACYALGTAWFMFLTNASLAVSLASCVVPFIIPDIAKGVCAFLLGTALEKRLKFNRV